MEGRMSICSFLFFFILKGALHWLLAHENTLQNAEELLSKRFHQGTQGAVEGENEMSF